MTGKLLTVSALLLNAASAMAQKTIYIPQEWRNRTDTLIWAENDPDNKYTWSLSRSKETDNVIILWDKGYGSTNPSNAPSTYRVDINDLSAKAEAFYQLECDKLGFVDPGTSNLKKYKVMVLLNHDSGWICYGGGYDYQVPALWLSPSTCKPVGSAVAHEVGHSFHYMCYSEASDHGTQRGIETGFHTALGNGQAIWETTANWQSLQSYPNEIMTMSNHNTIFNRSHNYAFSHEWHRYQAYMFLAYLCQRYDDIQTVANVWNQHETKAVDFNEALMDLKGLTPAQLYGLHFDFALHAATWDLDACRSLGSNFIGNFEYRCSAIGDSAYQVAYASCPQGTGFNIIPLSVPEAGTVITTDFTALRPASTLTAADPVEYLDGTSTYKKISRTRYNSVSNASYRGFRLGYVVLLKDGTRQYIAPDSIYGTGSGNKTSQISVTVPENADRMWLVVAPSLKSYIQHKWDENIENDDMWPYQVRFHGTDLTDKATVYAAPTIDQRAIEDVTFTYDVYRNAIQGYTATAVTVGGQAAATLGTAFQLQPSDIASMMSAYSAAGPQNGHIMFYGSTENGALIANGSTANGYGHWFNASGNVTGFSNNPIVYSEFTPASLTFNIGNYPNKVTNGSTYTISQTLLYRKSATETAKAQFIFHVHFDAKQTGVKLASVKYDANHAVSIEGTPVTPTSSLVNVYSIDGTLIKKNVPTNQAAEGLRKGLYIIGDKKIAIR